MSRKKKKEKANKKRKHYFSKFIIFIIALAVCLGIAYCRYTGLSPREAYEKELYPYIPESWHQYIPDVLLPGKLVQEEEDSSELSAVPPDTAEEFTEEETSVYGIDTFIPEMTSDTVHLEADDTPMVNQYGEEDDAGEAGEETIDENTSVFDALELTALPTAAHPATDVEDTLRYKTLNSSYMVLVDMDEGTIVAERSSDEVVSPASMTKILTVLAASEFIKDLDDTYTMTQEILNYAANNSCSVVGLVAGDVVTVRDLLYGTILASGADCAMGLADYCCGSQEKFVERMNSICDSLGISDTAHFTNVVGVYDEDLHCTVTDMAVILTAAAYNDICFDALSARTWTISAASGDYEISNWFLRRIEDKDTGGEVTCGKTGFVNESGCCAASGFVSESGHRYICVTANSYSSWRTIYDHVAVYRAYTE